jgi:hypothetical protein
MTNIGDVIRQIEKIKCDRQYPPTQEQQETLNRILHNVYSGTVEFRGASDMSDVSLIEEISLVIRVIEGIPILVLIAAFLVFSYVFRNESIF